MKKKITLITLFLITCVAFTQAQSIAKGKEFTLEDFYVYWKFYPNSVDGLRSMNDGEHYTTLNDNQKIVKYAYKTGEVVATLLDASNLKGIQSISNYQFSEDETKILLTTKKEAIYRRSYTAEFFIWDILQKKLIPVSQNGRQQLATLSPDGKNAAFVRQNNIFITNLESGTEKQITTDGRKNEIINGAPDWVYEEEFEFNKAFCWSPDSKHLAYMRFDEGRVKEFSMTVFKGLSPELKKNALYPEVRTWKYPKAGDDNSIVSVQCYNTETQKTKQIDIGKETDIYIPRIKWSNDNNILAIMRLNRLQNKLEFLLANPESGNSKVVYTEENKYYIEESNFDNLEFLNDNKHFIYTGEHDGWIHLYLYNMDGTLVNQITKGDWQVTDYLGCDEKTKTVYYVSTESSPLQRDVYSIKLDGSKKTKLSTQEGTNKINFSEGFKYYILTYSSTTTPTYITLHDIKGKQIRVLEDNADLKKTLSEYKFNNKEFFKFKTTEGIELNGWMLKPIDFDQSKKYPVLFTGYNGPGSQEVSNSWEFGWENILAQKDIIVVSVDTRGTGFRGEEFKKCTYLQLGNLETKDWIETAKYIGNLSFIDKSRIGIWGWSYGGFMACSALTRGADYFKLGVAVAPVTNWRYYDNIYTERFMRKPQENAKGYDENSPTSYASKLKGKLLICHGTADDNVHFQNTAEFTEALVQAGKQFDEQIYTNRNHGIYGGNTTIHLYTRMLNYIFTNL